MPTTSGIPVPAPLLPAGPLNPYDWISLNHDEVEGVQQSAIMRGHPGACSAYQGKQIPQTPTVSQAGPFYLQSRPFSRGADAYSPRFGVLNINPIGAGIDAPYKLPVIAGPGARYQLGAIWFDVQAIPTTINISPSMSIQSLNALLSQSYVAAMYPTTG
jgi:hypothetical protein